MMQPINFPEQNIIFFGGYEAEELPAHRARDQIVSCWKGTFSDRIRFLLKGRMYLSVKGDDLPLVWMDTDYPFERIDKSEAGE